MAATSTAQLDFRLRDISCLHYNSNNGLKELRKRKRLCFSGHRTRVARITSCCSDSAVPIRRKTGEMCEERRFDQKKTSHGVRIQTSSALPFASTQSCFASKQEKISPRCTPRNSGPQSRDSPPKRVSLNSFFLFLRTDKWAETELGTKWGDKWEEKFFAGIGSRQGETWHVSPSGELKGMGGGTQEMIDGFIYHDYRVYAMCMLVGQEHGERNILETGKFTNMAKAQPGESWDIVVDEETYYEAEPHYGWADVVGDSSQLLSITPRERPPGVYPSLDFGSSTSRDDDQPDLLPPSS
ncbi:hypothetical protein Pint_09259 [Pistacia integerrima]|uniref:Uncharacterized protein n=1 Tax=Pistacia integerrima TaxID=434235 RepID=A0ACC0XXS5_9ROSI|nr:hypothetical protein Pint_09259 [Pistacia integerrima]